MNRPQAPSSTQRRRRYVAPRLACLGLVATVVRGGGASAPDASDSQS